MSPDLEYDHAMVEYRNAQAEYFRAQAAGQRVDNETAQALATSARIALEREQLKEAWDSAANGRNRVYHFTDDISQESVEPCIDVLNRWQRIDVGEPLRPWRFVICSPGGAVVAGLKLYSTLKSIARARPLVTVASGMCASMATVVFQAGSTRVIEPGCSFMVHDVSGGIGGSLSNMSDTMEWLSQLNAQLHVFLAERSNLTVEEIAELSKRRDAWFLPKEVIAMGLADEIGYATD